jgi:hypothetical protein
LKVGVSSAAASPSFPAASKPRARGRAAARGYQSLQMIELFSLA